ncbi:hypothetical protein QE369_002820 [Agrobacterium larrymoorei]|uniref:Uncharacterized protein n=1 Tax=Agrobacterium larrymoorei TaxID=160699 RepID=A0AAJ2ETK3_9HYPH|nr:hypothetical protein [Agrobacterium larrymoorei]MDR6102623.1 hypothetical protein [Agrobacterium larrymoorei]
MSNFINWLRYVLDIEKPYSDYESDTYLDRKLQTRPSTSQKIIVASILILGVALILAD